MHPKGEQGGESVEEAEPMLELFPKKKLFNQGFIHLAIQGREYLSLFLHLPVDT